MISGQVPQHLVVMARTGFLSTIKAVTTPYQRITSVINMGARSMELVDLGGAPMPTQNVGRPQGQDFIEKSLTIAPKDWDITVWISHNAIEDDQTGSLERRVRAAGANFQAHINKLVFEALNNGDAATSLGYDGISFFDAAHVDKGANYTTAQDNELALALSLDNFNTAMVAARAFRDDQGEFVDYNYDLLVVPPALEYTAAQITGNVQAYDTANREANPFAGRVGYLTTPYLDATASILVASSEQIKPMILAMREMPNLQSAWFDPEAADGGRYYFKFFARYNVFYGDWRLAIMINT